MDTTGRYTNLENATMLSGPEWTIAWGIGQQAQSFFRVANRYHARGIMALNATNASGEKAVVPLHPEEASVTP